MAHASQGPIAIFGAGSVGCWIGGAWMLAGCDIRFIGRKRIQEEIRDNGLTLTDGEGRRMEARPDEVKFTTSAKGLAGAALIALCVKSEATEAAAAQIKRQAAPGTIIVSFQNGISNVDRLKAALPGYEVLQGMVPFNVAHIGNGRWHKGVAGSLWVEDSPSIRPLASKVERTPGHIKLAQNMKAVAWGKLLINLNNAVNALSGLTLLEQLSDRDYRRVVAASQVEALDVLEAAGIEPAKIGPIPPKLLPHVIAAPDFLFRRTVLKVQRIDANARSSMADDFAAGRPTEIDYLNGEVVRLARSMGRRAPVNERIVELVRQAEAGVERAWSGKELRDYALEGKKKVFGFDY